MSKITAWDRVTLARELDRPKALDYLNSLFKDFIELHGDRNFGDDKSIVGGIATLDGKPVTVIGEQKGKNVRENMERNFGMPEPEGYRKALRLMKQAEKFKRPIITFIDTPGAYPGMGAEERGQGEAIAKNLMEMSRIKVPIISTISTGFWYFFSHSNRLICSLFSLKKSFKNLFISFFSKLYNLTIQYIIDLLHKKYNFYINMYKF